MNLRILGLRISINKDERSDGAAPAAPRLQCVGSTDDARADAGIRTRSSKKKHRAALGREPPDARVMRTWEVQALRLWARFKSEENRPSNPVEDVPWLTTGAPTEPAAATGAASFALPEVGEGAGGGVAGIPD
jgi:hypothetical protein